MDSVSLFWLSFLAGMYAPLGSPCVIVLYPGYISFLATGSPDYKKSSSPVTLGTMVAVGVIVSLLIGGVMFTGILNILGGGARVLISAVLFLALLIFSIFLIFGIDYGRWVKTIPVPRAESPLRAAFLLGLAFGAVILPCNAASIAVLLALAASAGGFIPGLASFVCFGLGMTFPLIIVSGLSQVRNRQITGFLQRNQRIIQVVSGLVMLGISAWYLELLFFPGTGS